jgi:hypothetical protein
MDRDEAIVKLSGLCMTNADALQAALQFCADNGIGCFRINSQILPIKTHAECGYDMADPHDVGVKLNDFLLSAIAGEGDHRYGKPKEAFKKLASQLG